jgi:hypothetical protein
MDRIESAPSCKFGTGPQRYLPFDFGESSNDLILGNPDNQDCHFKRTKKAFFPTDTRDNYRNAFLMTTAPEILLGLQSPGPCGYNTVSKFGRSGRKVTMASRTATPLGHGMTSPAIGPGSFEKPASIGIEQRESCRSNQAVHKFSRSHRECIPRNIRRARSESIPKYYPSVSSLGRQARSLRPTEPRPTIGSGTRSALDLSRMVRTPCDFTEAKMKLDQPKLLIRNEILRWAS